MFGREIFRKNSLKRLTTPEDLDELLQVNSVRSWLLFAAIAVVTTGLLMWGILGSVSQIVKGTGIIIVRELPREVSVNNSGQVDSVFCKTGDIIIQGQKLMTILNAENHSVITIIAPADGEITGLNVREGEWVNTGFTVLEMMRNHDSSDFPPEVTFYIAEKDISKLKTGMTANLTIEKEGVAPEFLHGFVNFIADHPASKASIRRYFSDDDKLLQLFEGDFHEIRAGLAIDFRGMSVSDKKALYSLNGLPCSVTITVARQSPVAYLMHSSR